jgi:phosphohistidine swiveling domain-containing protein
VEGVPGHPGALLSGWAEGASGRELAELVGPATVAAAADLAARAWRLLGDDVIEWAAVDGVVWLLQSGRSGATAGRAKAATEQLAGDAGGGLPFSRARMPLLAATVLRRGEHVPGRPGAPGTAAGRLLACRPHERPAGDCGDAILLVDRPLPALAPLLFAARGVIARTGAAGSHLAEVARSLGVPMVLGCRPERVTGAPPVPDGAFLAAIDGSTGDVALLPAVGG